LRRSWRRASGTAPTRWSDWWIATPTTSRAIGGYGRDGRVLILARVLQDESLAPADAGHSKARNLLAMLKRLESDPLPFAKVRARLRDGDRVLAADEGGGGKAHALGVGPAGPAPTVVVDKDVGAADLE
jgi:hypothetical protein